MAAMFCQYFFPTIVTDLKYNAATVACRMGHAAEIDANSTIFFAVPPFARPIATDYYFIW
jgi:hypothetical protein